MSQVEDQPVNDVVPDAYEGEMSFEEAMQRAVQLNSVDSEPQAAEPEISTPDPKPVDADEPEKPETDISAEPEVAQAPEAEKAPEEDKSFQKLMQREADLKVREERLHEAEADLNVLRQRLDTFEAAQRTAEVDPITAIRELMPNQDLKRLAEMLWYENQGEAAPASYKQQKAALRGNANVHDRLAKLEQEREALMKSQEEQARQREAQAAQDKYIGSIQAYAEKVSAESNPLVSAFLQKDAEQAKQALVRTAFALSQRDQRVYTPEEAAKALEDELAFYQLTPQQQAQQAQQEQPEQVQGHSLRNKATQVQPDRDPDQDDWDSDYAFQKSLDRALGRI